jgi:hypothetical protein
LGFASRGLRAFFSGVGVAAGEGLVGTNGRALGVAGLASGVAAGIGFLAASVLILACRSAMRFSSAASASLRLSAAVGLGVLVSAIFNGSL